MGHLNPHLYNNMKACQNTHLQLYAHDQQYHLLLHDLACIIAIDL